MRALLVSPRGGLIGNRPDTDRSDRWVRGRVAYATETGAHSGW
jgi:hypothetical protein